MEDTKAAPVSNTPATNLKVTVTLSPNIQQKLIQLNEQIFAAISILKELGLLDAAASVTAGKTLTPQTLSISSTAADRLCQVLSRVPSSDPIATEAVPLVNSIPTSMRRFRPSIARPLPAPAVSPMRPPQPVAKPVVASSGEPVAKPASVKPVSTKKAK